MSRCTVSVVPPTETSPPRGEEDTLKSKRWGREIPQELEEFVKKWLTF